MYIGLLLHEKERNKMPTPRHKVTHNPIPIYIFVSSKTTTYIFMQAIRCQDVVLWLMHSSQKQTKNMSKQNEDVGMGL